MRRDHTRVLPDAAAKAALPRCCPRRVSNVRVGELEVVLCVSVMSAVCGLRVLGGRGGVSASPGSNFDVRAACVGRGVARWLQREVVSHGVNVAQPLGV